MYALNMQILKTLTQMPPQNTHTHLKINVTHKHNAHTGGEPPHPAPISLSLSISLPEKDPVTPTVPRERENRARTNLSDWAALVKAVVGSME